MKDKKILITGGYGLLGSAIFELVPHATRFHKKNCDLTSIGQTRLLFDKYRPDIVIHLAAKVGGLGANLKHKAQFYTENILINTNVLSVAQEFDVEKLVSVMSSCIYPDKVSHPISEDDLHKGPPHPSNYGYAIAKRCLEVQSRCLRDEYGCNFITVVPCNAFGENDNFDLENSHVLPAVIRKIHEAKINNQDVIMWGTGKPLREFIYSKDIAAMMVHLLENYNSPEPVNLGYQDGEMTIKLATHKIAEIMNFQGDIVWDNAKPDGQYRKKVDLSRLKSTGWSDNNCVGLEQGLKNTVSWFEREYPNIRGIDD